MFTLIYLYFTNKKIERIEEELKICSKNIEKILLEQYKKSAEISKDKN